MRTMALPVSLDCWYKMCRWLLLVAMLAGLTACSHYGPGTMQRDRIDYVNATAESWKQQTLLNIVKMRYADTPIFLDVGQIISGYQLESSVEVSSELYNLKSEADMLSLGATGRYTDKPTITYTPITGAHFIQVMMTPIPPPSLLMLIESGWPADMILQAGAQSINGISNSSGGARGRAADPDFARLLMAFQRVQASGGLGLRMEVSKESKREDNVIIIRKDPSPEVQADIELVRKLLGLRPGLNKYKIIYGVAAESDDTIAIQTRSGFQIMIMIGSEAEVPPEHIKQKRTYPLIQAPDEGAGRLPPLVRVLSGTSRPSDSFVSVKYRGHWYWIDDTDFRSKGAFTFLTVIMTLGEKDEKISAPVITIQGN